MAMTDTGAVKTPEATAYAAPNTAFQQADVKVNPSDSYITNNSLVQNQLANILSKGSPLLKMAETSALQRANASGNLNTSMANQSALAAVAQTALPIAQQDAGTYSSAALNNQQTVNSGALGSQLANYDNQTQRNTGLISGALNSQNFGNTVKQANLDNTLAKDFATFNQPLAKELAQQGYDAAYKQTQTTTSAAIAQQIAASMGSILGNKEIGDKISAREALISATQTALKW